MTRMLRAPQDHAGSDRSPLDSVNRQTWSRRRVVDAFDGEEHAASGDWWSDPGERAAFSYLAHRVRNQPVLDVGVGGGRTTPLLQLLTDEYLGIDYTPEMVERCRRANPGADIRYGDVRDLSEIESERFGLVVFSFNGLDAIDHEDRQRGLQELYRVLRPGGLLLFSTHNMTGPAYRATPWRQAGPIQRESWSTSYRLARFVGSVVLDPGHIPRSLQNYRRLHSLAIESSGWGTSLVEAHDFDLLVHFTTLSREVAELGSHGFVLDAVFDAERGHQLDPSALSTTRYFHFVAHRPG